MADVKLLKYDGTEQRYLGVERVQLVKTDGGTAIFSEGEAVEEIEISPDFSSGDMTVDAPEGTLVKSAVIKRPDTLIPENIPQGINIGGVEGSKVIPISVEEEIILDFSDGAMEVVPDAGTVFSKVSIPIPEGLAPENIVKGIVVAGIEGTNGGGETDILSEEILQWCTYQIDTTNNRIILWRLMYDILYEKTGSYDVHIPDKIGDYDVIISCL